MVENAPCQLYANFKISKFSEFSDVSSPPPHPSLHVNYRVREPHVSHTGINVCAHCPLHLPKKVTEKPSVNHIGSSDEPPMKWNGEMQNKIYFRNSLGKRFLQIFEMLRTVHTLHFLARYLARFLLCFSLHFWLLQDQTEV